MKLLTLDQDQDSQFHHPFPKHFALFSISEGADSTPGDKRSLLTCTACAGVFPNLFICQMSLVFTEEFLLISQSHSAPQRCTCHRVNKQGGGQHSQLPPSQTRAPPWVSPSPAHPDISLCRLADGWVEVTGDRNVSGHGFVVALMGMWLHVPPAPCSVSLLHHGSKLE